MLIQLELCEGWKFDHNIKWYEHTPEFVQENESYKSLCDFVIQKHNLIYLRRAELDLKKSNVGDLEKRLIFYGYYVEVCGRALLHSLDCSTLSLTLTL